MTSLEVNRSPEPNVPSLNDVSFSDLLGYDRCPIDLMTLKPDGSQRTLYLPWHHIPENVPALLTKIEEFALLHPASRVIQVATEVVMRDEAQKRELEKDANGAISGNEVSIGEIDRSSIPPLEKELYAGLREMRERLEERFGEPYSVKLHLIDIAGGEEVDTVVEGLKQLKMSGGFFNLINLPAGRIREIGKVEGSSQEECRGAAMRYLGSVLTYFEMRVMALVQMLSPERNDTMAKDVARLREESDAPLVAVFGGAHAGVAFRNKALEPMAMEYIGLSESFLGAVPESTRHQSQFSLLNIAAALSVEGQPIPADLLKRALFQELLECYFDEELSEKGGSATIDSRESLSVTLRALCTTVPEEEVDVVLDEWLKQLFLSPHSSSRSIEHFGNAATAWLASSLDSTTTPGEVVDGVFDRYLRR